MLGFSSKFITAAIFASISVGNAFHFEKREPGLPQTWTDQVRFDSYSLIIKGQRVFLHSGEFMTYRLPVPDLWADILQKFKAAGLNALSLYTHMGSINPSRGVVDFEGYRALKPLFEAANAAGIWVVLRPGPYVNAETSAGGIAHWVTTEIAGHLRSNDSDYHEAWTPYIEGMVKEAVPYQIINGGPIIAIQVDNEYGQDPGAGYFEDLKAIYKNKGTGLDLPLTYNDPGMGRSFINGTGAVDIYGFDAYPNRYDCAHPDVWKPVPENYHEHHLEVNSWQPLYIPEYQGGSPQAWGPNTPDYTGCYALTGPDFESVFHRQLWADNVKLLNYYPLYGGTSWGSIPYHGVYTSYDWGAAISEPRTLGTKFTELKLQGLFLRSSPEFYKTDVVANSTEPAFASVGSVSAVNNTSPAFSTLLRNPDSGAGFWIVRQKDSTSTAVSQFKLTITTSSTLSGSRQIQIPQHATAITLNGRESKVIVTDYLFGSSRALYSTASVLFAGTIDGKDVLFLYGDPEQEHEVALTLNGGSGSSSATLNTTSIEIHSSNSSMSESVVRFGKGIQGLHTVHSSAKQLVLFADTQTAKTFWSPVIAAPNDPHGNFWSIGTNETVLVGGPYLVRTAEIGKGVLTLNGDTDMINTGSNRSADGSRLTIVAPRGVTEARWNGKRVTFESSLVDTGYRTGIIEDEQDLTGSSDFISKIPDLSANKWKYADSLPEIRDDWDDSKWVVANRTNTNVPFPMWYGDGRVLYGCDYGFCEGAVVWRGHFKETGVEKSVNLSINGGQGFAASVWLNDVFLNTSFGNSTNSANNINETDHLFVFPEHALKKGRDNVVTVLQDNMGLNENWFTQDQMKSPRGIRGFKLNPSGNFSEWRVQGKVGGYTNFPDRHRGVMNEGGFFGERKGWHLPGFDTSSFENRDISSGLPNSKAGVGFFVTTFILDLPKGFDVPMSINFEDLNYFQDRNVPVEDYKPYRAIFFVNGWMMGKVIGNLGPQVKFPVHEGILDYQGKNTLAVALWSMTPNVTISPQVRLRVNGVFQGGIENIKKNNPGWSAEGRK